MAPRDPASSEVQMPRGAGETVLVVDDVPVQRQVASEMLAHLGYAPVAVSSGEEALQWLAGRACDLVLLDMIMAPGMDGLDTYRAILERHPGQRALLASGFSATDRVNAALALGAHAYLKKPYTLPGLAAAVSAALD
jgi:CheY-like chemotaxis protein